MPFCSFSNFSNTFLTSLLRFLSKIKIFMAENSFFLFSFSCFILMFPVLFSLLMVLSRGSDGRRQNTSPREMSEANGENGQQSLKRRSFVGVFFSMTEGLSWWTWINHGECLGWWFLARFGSNSVFLVIEWLVCDTDSPRDIRWWMLIIISLCFLCLSTLILLMFTLLPQHVAKSYWKHWATWGGEAEPRGFNGLCRRSKEDRARNTKNWRKTTPWHGRENKQTGR